MADFSLNNLNLGRMCTLVVLALACPAAVSAETETLTLRGHVHAHGGKPLTGVVLRVGGAAGKFQQESVTDASGAYRFDGLQPGRYNLEVRLAGFVTLERSIALEGRSLSSDLVMMPASAVPPGGSSPESRNPTPATNASRQPPTRRQRGFQTLTLQTPENLDASQDGSPAFVGSTPAPNPSGSADVDSRSSDALLIQGSVSSDSANSPFGEGLSEDRLQEIRERIREGIGRGEFPGNAGASGREGFGRGEGGGELIGRRISPSPPAPLPRWGEGSRF